MNISEEEFRFLEEEALEMTSQWRREEYERQKEEDEWKDRVSHLKFLKA